MTEELNMPVQSVSCANLRELHALRTGPAPFSFFSLLSKDVISYLGNIHYDANPESEIGQLLKSVAYADQKNIAIIKSMLDANPELLLWASDTVDPAGNNIRRATPYQFALLAGDDYLANIITPYFAKLDKNGVAALAAQNAECKRYIDSMLTQPAYDFSSLLQMIKDAPKDAVKAALNCRFDEKKYPLHAALAQFRQDFAPREITEGMHFNYNNLLEAFRVYAAEFNNLNSASDGDYTKGDLFWRQVIGYIERLLPACDRQASAQGIYSIIETNEALNRSFNWRLGGGTFPHTVGESSCSGLGYEYARCAGACPGGDRWLAASRADVYEIYVKQKASNLQQLCGRVSPGNGHSASKTLNGRSGV